MSPETQTHRHAVVTHVRCPDRLPEKTYRQVLEELADLSPVVQALPHTAALVDPTGALRYSAPPSSIWSSASACACAAVARPPAP